MLGWITKNVKARSDKVARDLSTRHAEAVALENLKIQIDNRFRGRVFIAPPEAYELTFNKDRSWINDEDWERWKEILIRYPTPPRSQNEVIKNEALFWNYYADLLSVYDSNGSLCLTAHSNIMDVYIGNERWILRDYFAATGRVIDPDIQEYVRLYLEDVAARKPEYWGETVRGVSNRHRSELIRLRQEIEHHKIRGSKNHMEKWGSWFVTHVDDAFNRAMNASRQRPRSTKLGDGGFATLDEIRSEPSTQNQSTPRAQSQIFKD